MLAPIDILFEHSDFVIVNKPNNIAVQNEKDQSGILPLLCQQLKLEQLWLVHRLDKVTSGILIVAKNPKAAAIFGVLFENKQIEKFYLAISAKKPKKKQGWVKGDMEKGRNGSWLLKRSVNNPAITYFNSSAITADQVCTSEEKSSVAKRLYLVAPKTGKTHQIRVALKSLGCPILGDERYKGAESNRCYLHAFRVAFHWQGIEHQYQCEPTQGSWPDLKSIELLNEFFI